MPNHNFCKILNKKEVSKHRKKSKGQRQAPNPLNKHTMKYYLTTIILWSSVFNCPEI
jgi:hypothetical protein